MATAHSTVKAGSGRNPALKAGTRPKSANHAKAPAHRKPPFALTPPAQGPITTRKPGSEVAERGARVRVRGRLQDMIRAELSGLLTSVTYLRENDRRRRRARPKSGSR
jgi:hypothetical protein